MEELKGKMEVVELQLEDEIDKVKELEGEMVRLVGVEEEVLSLRGKALRMVANLKAKEEEVNKLQRTMDRQAERKKKKEGEECGGGGAEHGDSTATMYRVAKGLEEILLDMTRAMSQGFFGEVWTTLMRKTSIKDCLITTPSSRGKAMTAGVRENCWTASRASSPLPR